MGGALKKLPKTDTAKQFEAQVSQMENLFQAHQKGFRGDQVTAPRVQEQVEFYKENREVLRELVKIGEVSLGREFTRLEKAATHTVEQTPGSLEKGYTVASGAVIGALGSLGVSLLSTDIVTGIGGQVARSAGVNVPELSLRAAYEKVTGEKLNEATWKNVVEMFTEPSKMVDSTIRAYGKAAVALDNWHSTVAKVYHARETVMEGVLERNQEKVDSAYVELRAGLNELKAATKELTQKINKANLMGGAMRGFEDEASLFFVKSACETAGGVIIERGLVVGAQAGFKAAGRLISKGGGTAVEAGVETASAGTTAAAQIGARALAAGERAAAAAAKVERAAATAARVEQFAGKAASSTAKTGHTADTATSGMEYQRQHNAELEAAQANGI